MFLPRLDSKLDSAAAELSRTGSIFRCNPRSRRIASHANEVLSPPVLVGRVRIASNTGWIDRITEEAPTGRTMIAPGK